MRWILLVLTMPYVAGAQEPVSVDLQKGWLRRDWSQCRSGGKWAVEGDLVRFSSPGTVAGPTAGSDVLYWQVPTRAGEPLWVKRDQDWVVQCERPPLNFWNKVRAEDKGNARLLQASEHRYVQWKWGVRGKSPDGVGKRQASIAELGFSILRKGKNDVRELVYRWHDQALADTFWVSENSIVPGFFKQKKAHFVVHVAVPSAAWALELRDLYADYIRAFPKEEPGRVGRVYIKLLKGEGSEERAVEFTHLHFLSTWPDMDPVEGGRGEIKP